MLMKDPSKRPSLSRVLAHLFFTGKNVVRMAGMEATFDIFLSYRVASRDDADEGLAVEKTITKAFFPVFATLQALDIPPHLVYPCTRV